MKKLIVGCGYLGMRVARRWLAGDDAVYALTRSEQHAEQFRQAGITPIVGDVTRTETLGELQRICSDGVETVLYAIGYDRSAGPDQREVYVDGLRAVLKRISENVGRFVYTSSTSVYGQSHGETVDEDSLCSPLKQNGQICLDAEQVVWEYFPPEGSTETRGAMVLRLAGLYGPGRLIARITSLQSGQPLKGLSDAFLNVIHVDDAASAVLAAERHPELGRTFLVCDDRPTLRREYYGKLAELVDAPAPTFDEVVPDDPAQGGRNKRCLNRRLRGELGLTLQFPTMEVGLPHAVGVSC